MAKYRKKPVVIEATQWFNNGDHPGVNTGTWFCVAGQCAHCGRVDTQHGWVGRLDTGSFVCPGDWIITDANGLNAVCRPDIFEATYEAEESAGDGWEEQRNWQEQQQADREPQ